MLRPDVENYYDYREYLRDLFEWHKSSCDYFSHRYIVQKAGYKSPTVLKDVIDKKKNLSPVSAERFAQAFKLNPEEQKYFLILIKFNTAATAAEKDRYFSELTQLRKTSSHRTIVPDEYEILDNWWTLTLREALSLPDYKHSKKWLSRIVQPAISEEDVSRSLEILERAGMIKKENGHWESCDAVIKTERNVQSIKVTRYHDQMISLAQKALWQVPSHEREISGTTLRIPLDKVKDIKNRLYEMRQSILQMAQECEEADQVFQLNFQLFPLIKTERPQRLNRTREKE